MSFQAPVLLLSLLLLPAAIVIYLRVERRRRRAAEAFASPATMPSVAPLRPGWRRHAPMAAYAAALAILAIALARPERTVAVPDERASVMLVTDESGSMAAADVAPSRLEAAREAARSFLDDVPDRLRVGAVVFNHGVTAVDAPTRDRGRVRGTLERMRPRGGTATGGALATALALLKGQRDRYNRRIPGAIVLISDGKATHGRQPLPTAREAARARIPIYAVALGTNEGTIEVPGPTGGTVQKRVPPDREALRQIATASGGIAFEAGDPEELSAVYEGLNSRITTRQAKRQITSAVAAGGAVMLLVGGLMSILWFGRLP
jgi:Ca-activated chloride channel family protein